MHILKIFFLIGISPRLSVTNPPGQGKSKFIANPPRHTAWFHQLSMNGIGIVSRKRDIYWLTA